MNRISVVNGKLSKSKLRPERARARELDICNRGVMLSNYIPIVGNAFYALLISFDVGGLAISR